jgi:hypothetical protein
MDWGKSLKPDTCSRVPNWEPSRCISVVLTNSEKKHVGIRRWAEWSVVFEFWPWHSCMTVAMATVLLVLNDFSIEETRIGSTFLLWTFQIPIGSVIGAANPLWSSCRVCGKMLHQQLEHFGRCLCLKPFHNALSNSKVIKRIWREVSRPILDYWRRWWMWQVT